MPDILDEQLGQIIRSHRQGKNLSQLELAEMLDRAVGGVCEIEQGKTKASLRTIHQIAEVLHIDVLRLFWELRREEVLKDERTAILATAFDNLIAMLERAQGL